MHSYAFSSIFHAFNMQYNKIVEIAPVLKDMGFTHIQFPPIQPTRELSSMDIELLQKQTILYHEHLKQFDSLCQKAHEKNKLYPLHSFDYLLQKRVYYIREPTFRALHQIILDGISYENLQNHLKTTFPYKYVFDGNISVLMQSNVSIPIKLLASIQFIGSTHPYHFILETIKVLNTIEKNTRSLHEYECSLKHFEKEYKNIQSRIKDAHKSGNKVVLHDLIKEYSVVKKKRNQAKTIAKQCKLYFEKIKTLQTNSEKVKEVCNKIRLYPQKFLGELDSLHSNCSKKQKPIADIREWMNYIFLFELLVFSPWWLIYQPMKLSIGSTFLGSDKEVYAAITACKKHGLSILADVVINNLAAVGGEKNSWSLYALPGNQTLADVVPNNEVLPEAFQSIQTLLQDAFGSFDFTMITPPYPCEYRQEPTHCWMSGALPQLVQTHPVIQSARRHFLAELKNVGIDGIRIDAAIHLEPWVCEEALTSMPGLSYIEYFCDFNSSHKYSPTSYKHLRIEDFTIADDLYAFIFPEEEDYHRIPNYGPLYRQSHPQIDTVNMIVNHDRIMGSIYSSMFKLFPSKVIYELSVAYLLQRIYGQVLLMPHDIELGFVKDALLFRKKMREVNIVRDYSYAHVSRNTATIFIEKYDNSDKLLFISIFHLNSASLQIMGKTLSPYSFSWFSISDIDYKK